MSFFAYQAELGRDSARRAGGEVAVQRLRRVERLEALTYEEALATQVLIDEPDGFTARLSGSPSPALRHVITRYLCKGQ